MNSASMKITIFLFHLETCGSFAIAVASIILLVFGFYRTGLWPFLLLAFATCIFAVQLALHYYYFLRSYDLPVALKLTGTVLFFSGSLLSLTGTAALVFILPSRGNSSNQAMQRTAPRSDA